MTLRIYDATEIQFGHLSWLFIGSTGAGKTTLVGTFPTKIAHINFVQEKGGYTLRGHPGVKMLDVSTPADVIAAIDYVVANHTQFKTVAIDSVSTWCELLYRSQAKAGKVEWNHWKNWKSLIFSSIERLRALPLEVVITAGLATKDDDARDITRGGPAVFNSLKDELPARVEVYMYLESETDQRGFVKYTAYPSGKGQIGGRVRGTLPHKPIPSPTFDKIVKLISTPLFKGSGVPTPPEAPPPEPSGQEGADATSGEQTTEEPTEAAKTTPAPAAKPAEVKK